MTIGAETTHRPPLQEVDQESPANDHWGDYKEYQSPYEASVAAQKVTVPVPESAHSDPDEVSRDFGRYAAAPYNVAPVRITAADSWSCDDYQLSADANSAVEIAKEDPYRRTMTVFNRSSGNVYISPNPNAVSGWGSMVIPTGTSVTLTSRDKVYLFTVTGYAPGALPVVSVVRERYA